MQKKVCIKTRSENLQEALNSIIEFRCFIYRYCESQVAVFIQKNLKTFMCNKHCSI